MIKIKKTAPNIKLIASDIDGVWTDAKMHYTDRGEYIKSFSTYDGMAVSFLNKLKIDVGSLSDKSFIHPKKGWCLISIVTNNIL